MKNGVGTAEDGTSKVNPVRFPKQITPKKGSVKKEKKKKGSDAAGLLRAARLAALHVFRRAALASGFSGTCSALAAHTSARLAAGMPKKHSL